MEKWQNKIRHLRSYLRGWAKNLSSEYKKEKERLLVLIDFLDKKAEIAPLSESERVCLRSSTYSLACLRRDEESKWAQRAKVKYIQEGGIIQSFFI
jgi:hypothetical protein